MAENTNMGKAPDHQVGAFPAEPTVGSGKEIQFDGDGHADDPPSMGRTDHHDALPGCMKPSGSSGSGGR
ncbi:hypothetical protein ABIB82_006504 [Bradyrhizobium sp. i1.8.4]|uniref:hypothetical protein n=1 Tax=unclassified Bradyrhizobium TaxID=2631580 RepID=UPI003D1963D6